MLDHIPKRCCINSISAIAHIIVGAVYIIMYYLVSNKIIITFDVKMNYIWWMPDSKLLFINIYTHVNTL